MKISKILSILAIVSLFFCGCEKIDPPYKQEGGGGNGGEAVKKVLLEDYTGHDCVNCPTAAVVAEDLKDVYDEQLVVIAVHAGFFARPKPELPEDFRTEAGEVWDQFFIGTAGNPNGLVNRVEKAPGNYVFNYGEWSTAVSLELEKSAEAKITIENNFEQNKLTSTVTSEFLTVLDGTYNLMYCITQDSLTGPQKNNDANVGETPLIEEYEFMHVLRYTDEIWGENLTENVEVGKEYTSSFSVDFEADWVPENCHVVAFICNAETKTIIQVEEVKVID
ncbi:MAG: Omp28-related outer membrane protein [Bacteroidales bacterium]|jgi:thiol-disulfide isomerase/thioredoxin|nr:Omp28-related outer membrane protein [Bacteroidales bacterium]